MKFICFENADGKRLGVSTDAGIVDITAAGFPSTLNAVIAGGSEMLAEIDSAVKAGMCPAVSEDGMTYANVVENPSKILCVGLNYTSHAIETGGEPPKLPVFFSKFSDTLCPSGDAVPLPDWHRCYDYEAELVIIMGKPCYHVELENALDYVFGYTTGNDMSARDCQFLSAQWLSGKTMPKFAPAGPAVVTADSFDPTQSHYIRCIWNGNVVQDGDTNDMIFNCAEIVYHASKYFDLKPGDLIFTGTPAGVILGKPKGTRVWVKPGDDLKVEIEGIGTLDNPMV